jgi:murein DD-endopeptidase MepM/ murein hydrolase activator NlpD
MIDRLPQRALGEAAASLKFAMAVLFGGLGALTAIVATPVVLVVFTISTGLSHGLRLETAVGPSGSLTPGELACPVPGAVVSQPFGPSGLPGEPAMLGYPHFHTGVDLAVPAGTPIRAAEGGQVMQAAGEIDSLGLLVGYGNLVSIAAPDGRVDYYGHLTAFAVNRGDLARPGQVIGYVGSTGYSTGPHLHFEVRIGGTPVDPAPFMQPC